MGTPVQRLGVRVRSEKKRQFAFVDSSQWREKAIESPNMWADRFTFHFSETDQY
jgi:hypothetical protein